MKNLICFCLMVFVTACSIGKPIEIGHRIQQEDFIVVHEGRSASIVVETEAPEVCKIAAACLAEDIQRVSGIKPAVIHSAKDLAGHVIFIGTVDSPLIQKLSQARKVNLASIHGKWESAIIEGIDNPLAGIERGLVIAGSDRRGTAFGAFELSEKMGVSPWVWWADVSPEHHDTITVRKGQTVLGPPSIKYRGIFINDEDWGLQPWAAKTFEKDPADIGPKTYAKVFELLLRMKANFCWPAMHDCTKAFNYYPENKVVADRYAIVMGSTHCEPLLRNNVDEWKHETMGDWNYKTNRDRIVAYWTQRVQENNAYENVYTIGMRGVHDSGMVGVKTMAEKVALLQQAISDQRELLSKYVNSDPSRVPQSFCPYKEVLGIYESGLALPDDVTIVWVDDNHGYIRQLSGPQEQRRSGRSGVYYHFSYWGSPADYLWLGSTSPAIAAYEMHKACAYGADRLWVFNVGDIKPIEKEMTLAMEMAWDVDRWTPWNAHTFNADWAGRTFGPELANPIGQILNTYYRLSADGRPEHLLHVSFSDKQMDQRLNAYQQIADHAEKLKDKIPGRLQDAYFQLIDYPVVCAKLMNEKIFYDIRSEKLAQHKNHESGEYAAKAQQAYDRIQELTRVYNEDLAGGKWHRMMYTKPNNRLVFRRPDQIVSARIEVDFTNAEVLPPLVLKNGYLFNSSPDLCTEESGGRAVVEFVAADDYRTGMWFLARTPTDKEDSWFVSVNDWSGIVNNQVTGEDWAWIRAADVRLRKGTNRLTIRQREPNAAIKSVMFTDTAPADNMADPIVTIPAADFSRKSENPDMPLNVIPGYKDGGLTVNNFTADPLPDNQIQKASWAQYEADLEAGDYRISVRCMPTHRIHNGRGVRIGIAAGDQAPVIRDLQAPEWSGPWSQNVVCGYSQAWIDLHQEKPGKAAIRIYLPEPGVVLDRVNIYKE